MITKKIKLVNLVVRKVFNETKEGFDMKLQDWRQKKYQMHMKYDHHGNIPDSIQMGQYIHSMDSARIVDKDGDVIKLELITPNK